MADDYFDKLISKIDLIDDKELKNLILKLIDERNELADSIKKDSLTGVYNRRVLDEIDGYRTLVLCDVDNFKTINDSFGHDVGDKVLKIVANILIGNCREHDLVCRYGGDEFLLIFKTDDEKAVKARMKKVANKVTNSVTLPNFTATLSIGVTSYNALSDLSETIQRADQALYKAKAFGKNTLACYDCDTKKSNSKVKF